jgi:hypothetical protein
VPWSCWRPPLRASDSRRTLSQLELRESGGARAAFHTVVITDLRELADLAPSFDAEGELASGAPRFIVSATEIQTREVAMRVGAPVRMRVRLEPN